MVNGKVSGRWLCKSVLMTDLLSRLSSLTVVAGFSEAAGRFILRSKISLSKFKVTCLLQAGRVKCPYDIRESGFNFNQCSNMHLDFHPVRLLQNLRRNYSLALNGNHRLNDPQGHSHSLIQNPGLSLLDVL